MKRDIIEVSKKLLELVNQNQDSVLVTVIESTGSTPREKGARMIVTKKGRISGTIGGGTIEYLAQKQGQICLQEKRSCTKDYNLSPNEVADLGMICGGKVKILFQYIDPKQQGLAEMFTHLIELLETNQHFWFLSSIDNEQNAHFLVYNDEVELYGGAKEAEETEETKETKETKETEEVIVGNRKENLRYLKEKSMNYFIEEFIPQGKVYIFGGGHVSQALVPILRELDFRCVVLEDREDFLTEDAFPTANERIQVDFKAIAEKITPTEKDYAVVITRSHQFDYELQKQLLATPIYYIGVMGSKRKTATQKESLKKEGYSQKDIKRINMPIGINIKAETLKELAISISAELILKRADRNGK